MPMTRRRRWLWISAISVTVVVTICMHDGLEDGLAGYYHRRAVDAFAASDYASGIALLERAEWWNPNHVDVQLLLARSEFGAGEPRAACERLLRLPDTARQSVAGLDLGVRCLESIARDPETTPEDSAAAKREAVMLLKTMQSEDGGAIASTLGLARLGDPSALDTLLAELRDAAHAPASVDRAEHRQLPIRGLSFLHLQDRIGLNGYGTASGALALADGRRVGANALSIRVPGRQATTSDTRIRFGQEPPGGETDQAIRLAIRDAKQLGYRVMLKPHIMLDTITDQDWRGTIAFEDAGERAAWWQSYRAFIATYAKLAREEHVDLFCVGVELQGMVVSSPDEWSQLIAETRERFPGRLTYAANWDEYHLVPFWADLDLVGIQFFFGVSDAKDPTIEQLRDGLTQQAADIGEFATFYQRPVIFTEVGYKSTPGAAEHPWIWPVEGSPPDLDLQVRAYRAIFETFDERPYFHGMFWWNWIAYPDPIDKFAHDFTPQGKPALDVLREYWRD